MASELIERDLYNGKYHVVHNPNAKGRAPRYVVNDTKPKGVTTIMGATLAKDLISWAVGMTQDYLREKLPVITEKDLVDAGKAYMFKRDSGANTGTEAHEMVENYLKGKKQGTGYSQEATNAYNAFMEWFEDEQPEVINVEEVIYSESLDYAGTYDCMLNIGGKVMLCDLKTTNASRKAPNGIYAENFIQLGAYALAHEEQRQYEEANGGTKLLPIEDLCVISAKKNGQMDVAYASELGLSVSKCMKLFSEVMSLYGTLLETTNALGGK